MASGAAPDYELWVKDLQTGKTDRVLPTYAMTDYAISHDGKKIVFSMRDQGGHSALWIAPTNRRSSPVKISSTAVEDSPQFLPNGDVVFRAVESDANFLYRMKDDGTERRKLSSERVIDALTVSPDGLWFAASVKGPDEEHSAALKALPVDGGDSVPLCQDYCRVVWDTSGKFLYVGFFKTFNRSVVMALQDSGLPKLPAGGIATLDDAAAANGAAVIPQGVKSAFGLSLYAYTRENTRRNLYRVPLQ
jgi:hypothetical protein